MHTTKTTTEQTTFITATEQMSTSSSSVLTEIFSLSNTEQPTTAVITDKNKHSRNENVQTQEESTGSCFNC